MVNFRPLTAEICWRVWGTPSKFQRVSRLGSVTARYSSSGRQSNFAALNRGRHLYSAGRPSRWALAHILVFFNLSGTCHLRHMQRMAFYCYFFGVRVSNPASQHSFILMQIWAENGGLCPFGGGGRGFPSNRMWPGSRPTCVPSFILIHLTVWPQYPTSQTRQTDNGLIA